MTRLLLLALGLTLGYVLRRPDCQKVHVEYRHLDPAIVNRESDEGVQPPDPHLVGVGGVTRTISPKIFDAATMTYQPRGVQPPDPRTWPMATGTTWTGVPPGTWTWRTQLGTSDSALSGGARTGGVQTWPETLEHGGEHDPGEWLSGCPRCEADRWLRRGAGER